MMHCNIPILAVKVRLGKLFFLPCRQARNKQTCRTDTIWAIFDVSQCVAGKKSELVRRNKLFNSMKKETHGHQTEQGSRATFAGVDPALLCREHGRRGRRAEGALAARLLFA